MSADGDCFRKGEVGEEGTMPGRGGGDSAALCAGAPNSGAGASPQHNSQDSAHLPQRDMDV